MNLGTRRRGGGESGLRVKVTAERIHYWDGYDEGEIKVSAGRETAEA